MRRYAVQCFAICYCMVHDDWVYTVMTMLEILCSLHGNDAKCDNAGLYVSCPLKLLSALRHVVKIACSQLQHYLLNLLLRLALELDCICSLLLDSDLPLGRALIDLRDRIWIRP